MFASRVWLLGIVAVGFALAGCTRQSGPQPVGDGKVKVVATTSIIADTVRQVGKEHVEVSTLIPVGEDPHTYLPPPNAGDQFAAAHLVLFNGLHLEGKMTHLLEAPHTGRRAAAVSSRLKPEQLRKVDGSDDAHDPHVWFDVRLWMSAVEVVRDELAAVDPARAAIYKANAEAHLKELDALDREIKATVANKLPAPEKRVLVTSHDAFGYFAKAYGFEVRGLQGVSTATAAGTNEVDELANFIGQRRVPAIFCETSVRPKGLEKVLDTVKQRYGRDVHLVGGDDALFSDSLGSPGTPAETYAGTVRHNVEVIVRNLTR